MQYSLALLPALAGVALAQGVTSELTPTSAAPAGCTGSFDGKFEITVAQVTTEKRSIPEKRDACGSEGVLVLTLEDGTALDAQGRTGYIAANYQFQFDAPAQTGAIFTSGFSVCPGNILALGGSKTFYRCLSGDFYNLYDRSWAEQCEPVQIIAMPCGGDDSGSASESGDGQVVGTTVVQTTIITEISDGQPQVVTTEVPIPVCQISDGQVQGVTTPCVSATPTTTFTPISQSSDGQIEMTSGPLPPPAPTTPLVHPTTTVVASPPPVTSASVPAPSTPAGNTTMTSMTLSSPAPVSPTATTTPAPVQGGSSRVNAGSVGALVVGLLVAFVCL
ncbi:hypothetical protein F4780DRAFT_774420 [Xylariomycetidae sp. FL0641]|nr:hypothetical protein F4780DRAFT_774420 [Xylariomycetidae sp. FL0641]